MVETSAKGRFFLASYSAFGRGAAGIIQLGTQGEALKLAINHPEAGPRIRERRTPQRPVQSGLWWFIDDAWIELKQVVHLGQQLRPVRGGVVTHRGSSQQVVNS